MEKIPTPNESSNGRRQFIKNSLLAAGALIFSKSGFSKTEQSSESAGVENPRLQAMPDHNMPLGFSREKIVGTHEGKEKVVGSIFWFEKNKSRAFFLSNKKHPHLFTPEIDYEKITKEIERSSSELVIAFPGAYEKPPSGSGNIEGIAIENGVMVGEAQPSKTGYVEMQPNGNLQLHRIKDDPSLVANLVERVKTEKGSLYQQIPAIWEGTVRLVSPNDTSTFEWRAVCETADGRQFVLNAGDASLTLKEFLDMCTKLVDSNGKRVVHNLMLQDTGIYSYGTFRDKNQINSENNNGTFLGYKMVDERFSNKRGYTNVVVLGSK